MAYDGYAPPQALESLARLGATHVEPAYLSGGEPFDESVFSPSQARRLAGWLGACGLKCDAVSADVDLAGPDARLDLQRRLGFAAALGARLLVLPAVPRRQQRRVLANLTAMSAQVDALGLRVALTPSVEAGESSLPDAADFVAGANQPWLGLDFGTAQAAQSQPGLCVADQFDAVAADCLHLHLGDMHACNGWFPVPVGQGVVGCDRVLRQLARHPLSLTLELPLRLHRTRSGRLRRAPYRVPLPDIESAVSRSLAFVAAHLPSHFFH